MRFQIGPLRVEIHRFFSKWQRIALGVEVVPRMLEVDFQLIQYEISLSWIR